MTNDEFDALVFKLETQARDQPARYRLRLTLLSMLGNTYLATILLLILVLLGISVALITTLKVIAVKLTLAICVFLWMILKALWVKIAAPDGIEVRRAQSPALFAMIDQLCTELDSPPFNHVLMTDEFNAGVVQVPRLGIFGWHRNCLLLGLPLMKALTVPQFKAVLAHEFGHLAKGHGRASNGIYRQRLRWMRLARALDANNSTGSFLFKPFLKWYAPYFSAYSFPLARANEYEADATSARLTSSRDAAEALTSVSIISQYLNERYWPQIHRQADDLPQPGFTPYTTMAHGIATELDETSSLAWLTRALAEQTTSDDTHPALADRLRALGTSAHLAPPQAGHAADALLGSALDDIARTFDQQWQQTIQPSWEERYRTVQLERQRLDELNERHAAGTELSIDDASERARLTGSAGKDADGSLEQFRQLLALEPNNAVICFHTGLRLLARDDDAGCALLERSMELDAAATAACCQTLRDYALRRERPDQAQSWHQRLLDHAGK